MSHPMWVRGLKQKRYGYENVSVQSHPMWVRGLKPKFDKRLLKYVESHPMWVRGLKHIVNLFISEVISRTLCGCVD